MSQNLPTTSYAVLGLLSFAPMSGYDLRAYADKSIGHFWPLSKSQIYTELTRLEELGLTAGTDVEQEGVPDKRVYSLTDRGAQALDAWLAEPTFEAQRIRSGLLVKTFFAHRMPREVLVALLDRYRSEHTEAAEHLREVTGILEGEPHAFFPRATALLGLRLAEAAIAWADEVAATIPDERDLAFASPKAGRRVHEFFRATPKRRSAS